jgi:NADPH:quinone reductase-like Zn-dependent oxidoreductase
VAGGTAVQALADEAGLIAGQRVLVTGGAGGVGHFAVRYAKHLGAHVTATCGPSNVEFVAGLGADRVIDYTRTDVLACGETFDLVFDAVNTLDWRRARPLLVPGGLYLGTAGSTAAAIATGVGRFVASIVGGIRVRNLMLRTSDASLRRLAELAAAGVLQPHIARRVGLDGVAEAQRDMQRGHGRGKIVVLP